MMSRKKKLNGVVLMSTEGRQSLNVPLNYPYGCTDEPRLKLSSKNLILLGVLALLLAACGAKASATAATTPTSTLVPTTSTAVVTTTSTTATSTTTTTESTQSAAVVAAHEVRACMTLHNLSFASEVSHPSSSITIFERCAWPPPVWAYQDGYSQITVTMRSGPVAGEASDADYADYISSPNCHLFELQYNFGAQGTYSTQPAFEVSAGTVTSEDHPGQPWTGPSPYPYPTPSEVIYLHNLNQGIYNAQCVS